MKEREGPRERKIESRGKEATSVCFTAHSVISSDTCPDSVRVCLTLEGRVEGGERERRNRERKWKNVMREKNDSTTDVSRTMMKSRVFEREKVYQNARVYLVLHYNT